MRPNDAARIVALLQGAYPRQEFPDSTVEVYAMALVDLDYADVVEAVTRLVQTSRWLPTIAEIRERVAEARLELPDPEMAWVEVRKAIQRYGVYQPLPPWSCDEVAQAVEIIGWRELCTNPQTAASRARWIEAYRAIRLRAVEREMAGGALPGQLLLLPLPRGRLS